MTDFRELSQTVWASPQITPADIAFASEQGFSLIINNRPEGESPDQPEGSAIEAAARDAGMDYRAIPIGHDGFSEIHIAAMAEALAATPGKALAYCRSGTRSTFLWSLARAQAGDDPAEIIAAAAAAGYDVSSLRPTMESLQGAATK